MDVCNHATRETSRHNHRSWLTIICHGQHRSRAHVMNTFRLINSAWCHRAGWLRRYPSWLRPGEVIVRGCSQKAPVVPKHPTACANQPPHASISGRVDHGSVCCRDYARTETSLACIHGAEEPTMNQYTHDWFAASSL